MEQREEQLVLDATATKSCAVCPLCQQKAVRLYSRYRWIVKDLPCVGQQVQLILHVRKFFCDMADPFSNVWHPAYSFSTRKGFLEFLRF